MYTLTLQASGFRFSGFRLQASGLRDWLILVTGSLNTWQPLHARSRSRNFIVSATNQPVLIEELLTLRPTRHSAFPITLQGAVLEKEVCFHCRAQRWKSRILLPTALNHAYAHAIFTQPVKETPATWSGGRRGALHPDYSTHPLVYTMDRCVNQLKICLSLQASGFSDELILHSCARKGPSQGLYHNVTQSLRLPKCFYSGYPVRFLKRISKDFSWSEVKHLKCMDKQLKLSTWESMGFEPKTCGVKDKG